MGMSAPIWKTKAGTLGTIEEQQFYELQMLAINPEDPEGADPESLSYKIVAGSLPPGLVMYENGSIKGKPKNSYFLRGVPFEVKQDVTSTFCCRAKNTYTGEVTDRTFSLTVTGEDPPQILTNGGEIGRYFDGDKVSIQLLAVDLDIEATTWHLTKGSLPPGLSLDSVTGLIHGFIQPALQTDLGNQVGWSSDSGWEQYPWDYGSKAISASYQFSIQATDGKMFDGKEYSIFVYSHDAMTADNTLLSGDQDYLITADLDTKRRPVLLTESVDLGTYEHLNYFAYQFKAKDFDGDAIGFSLMVAENIGYDNETNGFDSTLLDQGEYKLPDALTLNTDTGWLYGQLNKIDAGQIDYQFAIRVYKKDYPSYQSDLTYFTMTVINDLKRLVTWVSDTDLGSIDGGGISEKHVQATNAVGRPMLYYLDSGELPQGLQLNTDGLILGRASFQVTSFEGGKTTFDKNVRELGVLLNETTVDRKYNFVVRATDASGELVSKRSFSIKVNPATYEPYESLYLRAQSGLADKDVINLIFRNTDTIPNQDLYRSSDPNFGRSRDLRMLLMSGIKASTAAEYTAAMSTNHYRKVLRLGNFKWAKALNDDGSIAYEIVYIELLDDLIEGSATVADKINLTSKIKHDMSVDTTTVVMSDQHTTLDGRNSQTIYPNSLFNMRSTIRQQLSLNLVEPLPRWMTSRQDNGKILGWIPVVPVAYVKPGAGDKVVFNLSRLSGIDIKNVSFDVDRYIWDMNLSKNYDASTNSFNEDSLTTFDTKARLYQDPVATVDFALDVPFSSIDGSSSSYIDDILGGLDGITTSYEGKTIIFAKQEQYPGFLGEEDGWVNYNLIWDDSGWDDPSLGWDAYETIVGYNDAATKYSADNSTSLTADVTSISVDTNTNEVSPRPGVWKITKDSNGIYRLELQQDIRLGQAVSVRYGYKYGGRILIYGPLTLFDQGETVPNYHIFEEDVGAIETIFDGRATKFRSYITVYEEPDQSDKYLAFPKKNIWA